MILHIAALSGTDSTLRMYRAIKLAPVINGVNIAKVDVRSSWSISNATSKRLRMSAPTASF